MLAEEILALLYSFLYPSLYMLGFASGVDLLMGHTSPHKEVAFGLVAEEIDSHGNQIGVGHCDLMGDMSLRHGRRRRRTCREKSLVYVVL